MPIQAVIPFELEPIQRAVQLLTFHRAHGRVVIDSEGDHS